MVGNQKSGSLHSRMDITVKRLCLCETGRDQVACFRLSNPSSPKHLHTSGSRVFFKYYSLNSKRGVFLSLLLFFLFKGVSARRWLFRLTLKNLGILRLMFHFLLYYVKMKYLYNTSLFINQRLKFSNFCA